MNFYIFQIDKKIFLDLGKWLLCNSENLKNMFDIILIIIGGICAIIGTRYLKKLKEKQNAAIFSFWSQLLDYLKRINKRMNNPALLNNLYSPTVRNKWTSSEGAIDPSKIDDFKRTAEDTISFIRKATDQMPAYIGWTEDYNTVTSFLDDIILCDISNSNESFKFTKEETIDSRNAFYNNVKEALERMIDEIIKQQKSAEKKLTKSKPKKREKAS